MYYYKINNNIYMISVYSHILSYIINIIGNLKQYININNLNYYYYNFAYRVVKITIRLFLKSTSLRKLLF
ncbi:hypothetical protein PFMC_04197 [Plasmodium falciparum CAMP/Malaysia]|uniref:Uncharacterized protein n=1 Tax=Plasmodium falciparum (isolate Camp / Malaysia) TaxID=5835 RepID=A0A024X322_PLAFC|nr:hypothetical protein PFMC_04197 [Plasmodium falciparum CAMP/Malaysia]